MDQRASDAPPPPSQSRKAGLLSWLSCFFQVPQDPHRLGRRGEKLAALHLRRQGYRIIDHNVRLPGGELDLVAVKGRTLVVVEVKTRKNPGPRGPAAAVTGAKKRRICRATRQYIRHHNLGPSAVRFDIVAITWPEHQRPLIEHHKSAFPWRSAISPATPIIPHRP